MSPLPPPPSPTVSAIYARHQAALSRRDQDAGCAAHLYIPDLVPGEQVDAGEDWVGYRLADGTAWRDGGLA